MRLRKMALRSPTSFIATFAIFGGAVSSSALADAESLSPIQPLATEQQLKIEATAAAILKTLEMQRTIDAARQLLLTSRFANSEAANQTLEQMISETAGFAALNAASKDPQNPGLFWYQTPRREWMGHSVSGSRFSFDNPDNIYRNAFIDDKSTYVFTASPTGPTGRLTVTIYKAITRAEVEDYEKQAVDTADEEHIKVDSKGAVRITIGPGDPKDGSTYLNSRGGAVFRVREAFSDWHRQHPRAMSLRKIAGPTSRVVTCDERVALAQRYMMLGAVTVAYFDKIVYPLPTNNFAPSVRRAQGTKPSTVKLGLFHLADDEALVVNVLPQAAEYMSFSVTSPWQVTRNFLDKTATRTSRQSHQNADGTYTYVLSRRDPGVANWMDTVGLLDGGMAMRWEGINAPEAGPNAAIKSVKLVKLNALRSELPANFPSVSAAERSSEVARRRADYEARCGVPCRVLMD